MNTEQKLLKLVTGEINIAKIDLDTILQWICELKDGNTYDVLIHKFLKGEYDDFRKEGWFCHIITYKYSEVEERLISKKTNMVSYGCNSPKEAVLKALEIMFAKSGGLKC